MSVRDEAPRDDVRKAQIDAMRYALWGLATHVAGMDFPDIMPEARDELLKMIEAILDPPRPKRPLLEDDVPNVLRALKNAREIADATGSPTCEIVLDYDKLAAFLDALQTDAEPSNELVDRVAQAIFDADDFTPDGEPFTVETPHVFRQLARGAIKAMTQPPQSDGSYVERYTAICEGFDGFGGDTDEKFHAQVVALLREADAPQSDAPLDKSSRWWRLRCMIMDAMDSGAGKGYEHCSARAEGVAAWVEQHYALQSDALREALRRILGWREADLPEGNRGARAIEYMEDIARAALAAQEKST